MIIKTLRRLFKLLNSQEKLQFLGLLVFINFSALLDLVSIASVIPFMSLVSDPATFNENFLLKQLYSWTLSFGIREILDFMIFTGSILFVLILISSLVKSVLVVYVTRFTMMREYSIGVRLFRKFLYHNYDWYSRINSADLSKRILSDINAVVHQGYVPALGLFTHGVLSIFIVLFLLFYDVITALAIGLTLLTAYLVLFKFTSKKIQHLGDNRVRVNQNRFVSISEAFGAIKEIKLGSLEDIALLKFDVSSKSFAELETKSMIYARLPRYLLELLAFGGLVLMVVFSLASDNNTAVIMPKLALFAFSAFKLLPALQQVYASISQLKYADYTVATIFDEMAFDSVKTISNDQHKVDSNFTSLELINLTYKYSGSSDLALDNVNLSISRGERIAFTGSTGSGKSTLIDILTGLLEPTDGAIRIISKSNVLLNMREWQNQIGYVPQNIYLIDASIAENIAFGTAPDRIREDLLIAAAKAAQIDTFINTLDEGYHTIVGERGSRLSGGQIQRIGIARALYRKPKVLILDEATSALDNHTESLLMREILDKNRETTIISIAHRISSIQEFDCIHFLQEGKIVASGSYLQLKAKGILID